MRVPDARERMTICTRSAQSFRDVRRDDCAIVADLRFRDDRVRTDTAVRANARLAAQIVFAQSPYLRRLPRRVDVRRRGINQRHTHSISAVLIRSRMIFPPARVGRAY